MKDRTTNTLLKRIKFISFGGAAQVLTSHGGVLISLAVIRTHSTLMWGEFVYYLLFIDFGFSFVSWGSTHYLMREFSLHPERINHDLGKSLASRSLLLVAFIGVLFLMPFPLHVASGLAIWVFARFIYQSFEPLAQNERHFLLSFFTEVVAVIIILIPVLRSETVNVEMLVILFALSMSFRAAVFAFYYRHRISLSAPGFQFFKDAFPFLLLTFSAMIQQRMDLYCVALYLDKQEIAAYQVLTNFLIFCLFASNLLLYPYTKNIFRLPIKSFQKLESQFMKAGVWLSALAIFSVFILIRFVYAFHFSWLIYTMSYFYVLLFYQYILRNYEMRKSSQIISISVYAILTAIVKLILGLMFIPPWGINGALFSALMAQIVLVILYHKGKILHRTD